MPDANWHDVGTMQGDFDEKADWSHDGCPHCGGPQAVVSASFWARLRECTLAALREDRERQQDQHREASELEMSPAVSHLSDIVATQFEHHRLNVEMLLEDQEHRIRRLLQSSLRPQSTCTTRRSSNHLDESMGVGGCRELDCTATAELVMDDEAPSAEATHERHSYRSSARMEPWERQASIVTSDSSPDHMLSPINLDWEASMVNEMTLRQNGPTLLRRHTKDWMKDDDDHWKDLIENVNKKRGQKRRELRSNVLRVLGVEKHKQMRETLLVRIVTSNLFTGTCSMVILANVMFIGYQSQISVQQALETPPSDDPAYFNIVTRVFSGIYTVELALRIVAERWHFITGVDWRWNTFDTLLVVLSLVEELLNIMSTSYFRALRVLRMVRALRMIRVLRFFRELRLMVCSIFSTLSSLVWALILLLLIMYLFSIVFLQAMAAYVRGADMGDENVGNLVKWYETLFKSMLTLFLAISGGQDWYELHKPLNTISPVYGVFFLIYVFFVVFGVLNVLIGVFVERAQESGKLDRDLVTHAEECAADTFMKEMHEIFKEIDQESTGTITREQFGSYVHNEKVKAYLNTRGLDTAAQRLFQVFDTREHYKEELNVDEFISGMLKLRGQAKNADVVILLNDARRVHRKLNFLMHSLDKRMNILMQGLRSNKAMLQDHARRRPPTVILEPIASATLGQHSEASAGSDEVKFQEASEPTGEQPYSRSAHMVLLNVGCDEDLPPPPPPISDNGADEVGNQATSAKPIVKAAL